MATTRITYYAHYHTTEGTAELVCGTGYLFRRTGEHKARLVHYTDPALTLLGRCDLAEAQRTQDQARGGFAAMVCGYGDK